MSERIYGWLLTLYPLRFRQEYGHAMRQVFRDRLNTENPWALWAAVLRDLAVSVPREHWRPRQPTTAGAGFTLSEEALRQMAKRNHHGPELLAGTITLTVGTIVGLLGNAPRWPLFSVFAVMLVLHVVMTIKRRGHLRRHWSGFEVTLDTDRIVVKRGGVVTTFLRNEIKLVELPGFGLLIEVPPDSGTVLPLLLTGYQELRETLLTWSPIETRTGPSPREAWFMRFLRVDSFLTVYALALMVRSPYYMVPLTCIASAGPLFLLGMIVDDKVPIKAKLIPFAMLLPLLINIVFALRH